MKNIDKNIYLSLIIFLFSCSSENNQSLKSEGEPIITYEDSLSYSMGINIGQNLPEDAMNRKLIIEGMQDFWQNNSPRINSVERSEVFRIYNIKRENINRDIMLTLSEEAQELSRENKIKGQEFLNNNKYNEGVRVFSRSQIQYKEIIRGNGPLPDFDDSVVVHYNGFFINGVKFDSSYDRGEPSVFDLKSVIPGWQQTLQKMPVGSKWKVFIPENLAYGSSGVFKDAKKGEYIIPPSSTLIFDIELISIVD